MDVVVSGSMEPAFYRGDIVAVQKADLLGIHEFDPKDVKIGDIVVYDAKWFNQPVIHRIIDIKDINGKRMKKALIASHFERLAEGNCSVDVSPYYSSVIVGLERVADHLVNVGYSIVNPTGSQK